jgi:hypothetical protein
MVQPRKNAFHVFSFRFRSRRGTVQLRTVAHVVPSGTVDNAARATLFHEIFFGMQGINRRLAGLPYAGV